MAYATVQDMIDRFTEAEVRALAPAAAGLTPSYVATTVERALTDASAELDSYLAVKFPVPLAGGLPLLVKAACDLAREALDRQGREPVREAGKRARQWAKDVAAGRATLGSGPEGDADAVPAIEGGVQILAEDRVFDGASLQAFLQ